MTVNEFAFKRLVQQIQDESTEAAIVILVHDGGDVDHAAVGLDRNGVFGLLYALTMRVATEIYAELPDKVRRSARVMLPTAEDARRLGIFKRNGH